jgi:hypothetical protein
LDYNKRRKLVEKSNSLSAFKVEECKGDPTVDGCSSV